MCTFLVVYICDIRYRVNKLYCLVYCAWGFFIDHRRYMAERLPTLRETLLNQSINQQSIKLNIDFVNYFDRYFQT